jgi:hypothetical protein
VDARRTEHPEATITIALIRLMAARLTARHIGPHGPIETEAAAGSPRTSTNRGERSVAPHPLSR